VDYNLSQKLGELTKPTAIDNIHQADGSTNQVLGTMDLCLSAHKHHVQHLQVRVMKNVFCGVLLGMDFLERTVVDLENMHMTLKKLHLPKEKMYANTAVEIEDADMPKSFRAMLKKYLDVMGEIEELHDRGNYNFAIKFIAEEKE
jgi:hypothetical protein